jgi:hypothetical protein
MKLNTTSFFVAALHHLFIPLTDAAINLRMFKDPRSVQFKPNVFKQRRTSGGSITLVPMIFSYDI